MTTGKMHQCPKKGCEYQWEGRTENPKACPRCKVRLDNPFQQGNHPPHRWKDSSMSNIQLKEKVLK